MNTSGAALRCILMVAGVLAIVRAGMRVRMYSAPAADPGFPPVTFEALGAALDSTAPDGSPLPFGRLPNSIAVALASGLSLDQMQCMLQSFSAAVPDKDAGLVLLVTEIPAGGKQLVAREPRIHFVQYSINARDTAGGIYVLRHLLLRSFLAQIRGTMRVVVFDGRDTVFQSSPFKDPRWAGDGGGQVGAGGDAGARSTAAARSRAPPQNASPCSQVRMLYATSRWTIAGCAYNRGWMSQCYGGRETARFKAHNIINAGYFEGRASELLQLFTAYAHEVSRVAASQYKVRGRACCRRCGAPAASSR